jgi:cell division protein FtsA
MIPRAGGGSGVLGLLDLGTSKVVCTITAPAEGGARVIGCGYFRSRGVKSGVIVDLDEAEQAVRAAVSQAERMAGLRLDGVHASITCGRLKSASFAATVEVPSGIVGHNDLARLMGGARAFAERDGRALIQLNRLGFRLDGAAGVRDPRGMAAARLAADVVAVTADEAPLRNLLLVVERCYLAVHGVYAAPYASALAVTSAEERRLGVTVVDFGGGTTTLAVFAGGHLVHLDAIPIGGDHVTFDIARALQTPLAEAERIKVLYGTLVSAQSDEHEVVPYTLAGEQDAAQHRTSKAYLAAIVRARMARLMEVVAERLAVESCRPFAGQPVVITGGASQLVGLADFAAGVLDASVRCGRLLPAPSLPAPSDSPAFAAAAGLFQAASGGGGAAAYGTSERSAAGYLGRIGQWLKDGL